MSTCTDNCKYANWQLTKAGRLHPSGDGRCMWQMPEIVIPVAFYFYPKPSLLGGYMNRKRLEECPVWEPK